MNQWTLYHAHVAFFCIIFPSCSWVSQLDSASSVPDTSARRRASDEVFQALQSLSDRPTTTPASFIQLTACSSHGCIQSAPCCLQIKDRPSSSPIDVTLGGEMSMILPGLEGIKDSWIPLIFRISRDKQQQQQPDPTSRLLPTASTHSTFYFRSQKAYTRLTMQFTTLITLLASRFVDNRNMLCDLY